eukprot:249829-Chlamydomonas_euryale.AAC.4
MRRAPLAPPLRATETAREMARGRLFIASSAPRPSITCLFSSASAAVALLACAPPPPPPPPPSGRLRRRTAASGTMPASMPLLGRARPAASAVVGRPTNSLSRPHRERGGPPLGLSSPLLGRCEELRAIVAQVGCCGCDASAPASLESCRDVRVGRLCGRVIEAVRDPARGSAELPPNPSPPRSIGIQAATRAPLSSCPPSPPPSPSSSVSSASCTLRAASRSAARMPDTCAIDDVRPSLMAPGTMTRPAAMPGAPSGELPTSAALPCRPPALAVTSDGRCGGGAPALGLVAGTIAAAPSLSFSTPSLLWPVAAAAAASAPARVPIRLASAASARRLYAGLWSAAALRCKIACASSLAAVMRLYCPVILSSLSSSLDAPLLPPAMARSLRTQPPRFFFSTPPPAPPRWPLPPLLGCPSRIIARRAPTPGPRCLSRISYPSSAAAESSGLPPLFPCIAAGLMDICCLRSRPSFTASSLASTSDLAVNGRDACLEPARDKWRDGAPAAPWLAPPDAAPSADATFMAEATPLRRSAALIDAAPTASRTLAFLRRSARAAAARSALPTPTRPSSPPPPPP